VNRNDQPDGADYELTIEGRLGPVLRWALRPSQVVDSRTCTTIRTAPDTDLTGLVEMLDRTGLRIESVWLLPSQGGSSHPGPPPP
jgi:hypothetical protein